MTTLAPRALAAAGCTAQSCAFDAPSAFGAISKLASRFGYVCILLPTDSLSPETRQIGIIGLSHIYRNRDLFLFFF